MNFFKFRCKNCGSRDVRKVEITSTKIVANYCGKKSVRSWIGERSKGYVCNNCCAVNHKVEDWAGGSYWDSFDGNVKDLIKYEKNKGYTCTVKELE